MIWAAITFCAPIASMVMIAPLMSTSLNSSGMAVISLDFSAQATCPSDRPYSLAQMLTRCRAPSPSLRSWLRLAVHGEDRLIHAGGGHGRVAECLQPVREAGLEGGRLEHH